MSKKGPQKVALNIHILPETKERLQLYAEQHHTTVSQAITDWIWRQPVEERNEETGMEEK